MENEEGDDNDDGDENKKKETATKSLRDISSSSSSSGDHYCSFEPPSNEISDDGPSSSSSCHGDKDSGRDGGHNNIEYWDDEDDEFDSDEDNEEDYMPFPSFPMGESYDQMVDVWSLGATLYSMVTGIFPEEYDDRQQQDGGEDRSNDFYDSYFGHCGNSKQRKQHQFQFDVPDHVSKEGRSLISSLLEENPSDRITLQDVLHHRWIVMNKVDKACKQTNNNNGNT